MENCGKTAVFLVNIARKGKYHKDMVGLGSIKLKAFCSYLQTESLQCFSFQFFLNYFALKNQRMDD